MNEDEDYTPSSEEDDEEEKRLGDPQMEEEEEEIATDVPEHEIARLTEVDERYTRQRKHAYKAHVALVNRVVCYPPSTSPKPRRPFHLCTYNKIVGGWPRRQRQGGQ